VQPQNWDELGKGVKNDRLDAAALCQRLDRYELGNKKAFSTVHIPTVDEERERAMSRQRQQLMRERQRVAAMGRSLLATHNIHVTGKWWKGKAWTAIKVQAPAWVIERLEVFIVILGPLEEQEVKLMKAIQEAAKEQKIPKGVGPLTFEILRREVGDWKRFNNRRQVSSYTGLCPREHSSGGKRRSGSVSKSGNPRVRAMLVEMVWRMMHWQPEYKPLQKWAPVLYSPTPNAAAKKKAVVAIARQLAVDLWRVFTGQVEAEKFGLVYLPEAA
jgi:transposase